MADNDVYGDLKVGEALQMVECMRQDSPAKRAYEEHASKEEEFLRLMLAPDAGTNLHAFTYHHIKSDVMLHHSDSMSNLGGRHSGSGRNADSPRSSARMSGTILTVKATGLEGLHLLSNGELGPELPEPEPETEDDNLYSIGKAGSADAEGLTGEIQPESEVSGSPQDAVLQYPSAVPVGQFQLGPHRCSRNGLPSAAPAARHMLGSNYLLAHKNPQRTMDMPRGSCPLPGSRHGLSRSSAGGGVGLHQRTVERAASRAHGTYGANVADALWNEFAGERRMSSYSAYGRPSVPTTGMPDVAGSYHSDRLVKVNVHSRYSVAGISGDWSYMSSSSAQPQLIKVGTSAAELLAEVREHVSMGNAEAAEASIESLWQLVFAKDEATVRYLMDLEPELDDDEVVTSLVHEVQAYVYLHQWS